MHTVLEILLAQPDNISTLRGRLFRIMTSGDTHKLTVELLKANDNFGLSRGQVTIMMQEKVPVEEDEDEDGGMLA